MPACAVCNANVHPTLARNRQRTSPDGLTRCHEHVDTPLSPDQATEHVLTHLEPEEGEDYYWAEERTYEVTLEARARATWVGYEDDTPDRYDLDLSEPEITDRLHRDLVSVRRFKARTHETKPNGDPVPFDLNDWQEEKLEDLGVREIPPHRKPRPEPGLEAWS